MENTATKSIEQVIENVPENRKTVVKLDNNFHIYIHGARKLMKYGTEKRSGRRFIKIYYDNAE